jgi:hypothetical protein
VDEFFDDIFPEKTPEFQIDNVEELIMTQKPSANKKRKFDQILDVYNNLMSNSTAIVPPTVTTAIAPVATTSLVAPSSSNYLNIYQYSNDNDYNSMNQIFLQNNNIMPNIAINIQRNTSSSPDSDSLSCNCAPTVQFNYKINNLTELMTSRSNMSNIMRTYFDLFSMGYPFIDCNQSREIVTQITSFQQFDQVIENMGKSTVTLLFLSIQTFCLQRLGQREIAKQLYNYCLQLLSQQMLIPSDRKEFHREANLACALITLSLYLVGEGGAHREQAKLFLHNCKYYVSNLSSEEHKELLKEGVKSKLCTIHRYMNLIELVLNQDDLGKSLEVIQRLITHFDKLCGAGNTKLNMLPLMPPSNPIANEKETIEYLKKSSTVLDDLFSKKKNCSSKTRDVITLTFKLMLDGLRLQVLMNSPNKNYEEMAKLADQITETVENNSQALSSCPTVVVHAISLAGKFHLKQQSESFLTDEEVIDKVERDLNALRVLEKYFGIVSSEYGEQIAEMEAWLRKKQEEAQAQTGSALFEDFLSNLDVEQFLDSNIFTDSSSLSPQPSSAPSDFSQDLSSGRFYEMLMNTNQNDF